MAPTFRVLEMPLMIIERTWSSIIFVREKVQHESRLSPLFVVNKAASRISAWWTHLTLFSGSGDDVSSTLAHDVYDVQWTVCLACYHNGTISRLCFHLVTITTKAPVQQRQALTIPKKFTKLESEVCRTSDTVDWGRWKDTKTRSHAFMSFTEFLIMATEIPDTPFFSNTEVAGFHLNVRGRST